MNLNDFKRKEVRPKMTLYRRHLKGGGSKDFGVIDDLSCSQGCNTSANAETLVKYGGIKTVKIFGMGTEVQPWRCTMCGKISYARLYKNYIDIDLMEHELEDLTDVEVISNHPMDVWDGVEAA